MVTERPRIVKTLLRNNNNMENFLYQILRFYHKAAVTDSDYGIGIDSKLMEQNKALEVESDVFGLLITTCHFRAMEERKIFAIKGPFQLRIT